MTRTGQDAIAWAHDHAHTGTWYRACLKFVRMAFDVPGGVANAGLAWDNAKYKHRTSDGNTIPAGVPVHWETAGVADHIAISLGNGLCRSTDAVTRGNADVVSINGLSRAWGMQLHGWSEDLNGVRIYTSSHPAAHVFSLAHVIAATKAHEKIEYGTVLKKAVAAEVGKGSMDLSNAILGGGFRTQYALVQKRYLAAVKSSYTAADINGIPGARSLQWLGGRHGFTVKD